MELPGSDLSQEKQGSCVSGVQLCCLRMQTLWPHDPDWNLDPSAN